MRFNKRLGGVIGALVMLLAGAAVVYAAFTATGSGSGTARAVTAQSINITPTTCANADLFPGGPAGAICFTLTNNNPYAVHFTSVTYPASSAIVANSATCSNANVSIASGLSSTLATPINVNANTTTGTLSLPGVVQMASTALDGCQGASFNVPITLTGTQQ
jgi:hypothetical protein